jgi:hypothetical protein
MNRTNQPSSKIPAKARKDRTVLGFAIGVFLAALVGAFIWGGGLIPTSKESELNSRPIQGAQAPTR